MSNNNILSVSEQQEVRLNKRLRLINEAGAAYPVDVTVTHQISEIRTQYPAGSLEPDARTGLNVAVAGRVVSLRGAGKLAFVVLQSGDGSRIQLMLSLAEVGEDSMRSWKELVDLGDHVFAEGEVVASRTSEVSIMVALWQVASKALRPLPNLHADLKEETRARHRYLDLILRDEAREMVYNRSKVMTSLRETLTGQGFLEIETPMLQTIQGGAAARPFTTHSNAFDTQLFLRIAPELFLKRAVIGGIDRVFEINRNFRNEGADSSHSPEFAMLEAYYAYTDYIGISEITRSMIQAAVLKVHGSLTATWADGTEYDFSGEWDYISMYDSLSDAIGVQVTPETSLGDLQRLAEAAGVQVGVPTHGKYVEELWEHHVKGSLTRPTFVMDFPVDTSPLVADHRSLPGVVEKWDLYVNGFELATGYSELVDPVIQRQRLVTQASLSVRGDAEAMPLDEEFLEALEYGMPPTGGMGMGVDRLLMALTGQGIRETILFPLVK